MSDRHAVDAYQEASELRVDNADVMAAMRHADILHQLARLEGNVMVMGRFANISLDQQASAAFMNAVDALLQLKQWGVFG